MPCLVGCITLGVSRQVKPAVIESWQYESKDFRKIRLTYIDAGIGAQVPVRAHAAPVA